jgi:type II secretory pathway predicted ATPase ExeA
MYLNHFNLRRHPFKSNPDPDFLYLSKAHARVKSYLDYSIWNKDGFTVITGKTGAGKTTLINHLMMRIDKDILAVKIHQTLLSGQEFLQTLLAKFGIEVFEANKAKLLNLIYKFFSDQHSQGHSIFLIVDEAQNLSPEVLEEIRSLAEIEIDGEEVFNCILVGHPELMDTLNDQGMEQLIQRVRLRCHIPELSEAETQKYIHHRLSVAGLRRLPSLFPDSTIALIYEYTNGIPRLINTLCDAAMIAAYACGTKIITNNLIQEALEELQWATLYNMDLKGNGGEPRLLESEGSTILAVRQDASVLKNYQLDESPITLGRSLDNDIVLGHKLVSRKHAKISVIKDKFILEDLGSSNGTYIKDRKTNKCTLKKGDKFKIGPYELECIPCPASPSPGEPTILKRSQMP